MRKKLFLVTLAVPLLAISGANGSTVLFDFRTTEGAGVVDGNGAGPTSGSNFDPSGVGDVIVLGGLATTIVDILAPEYSILDGVPTLTGNTLSAAAGDNVTTNISGQDALGFSNPSISNAEFDLIGGGTESGDINPGEAIVFSFDQDVIFTSIELESVVGTDTFRVLVDGVLILETTGDDSFLDSLGALGSSVITAGSEITFQGEGNVADSSFRIETFEVDVVPEPSSLALLGLGSLMMFKRRRS